ncbi:MAG: AI-2E family transporter [Verrucomicrobia bacterium]|nr:AI-2E family transporter [Verrucomicrobiota bacterium]MDA0858699.1 AI-2E family transporter [Verrucomicrobiota bacterium]MDA1340020.1 AI-2E family transporter [Verrucomicrobiota bacterium]
MNAERTTERSLEHPIIWIAVIAGSLGSILLLKAVAWLAFPLILAVVLYYLVQPLLQRLQLAGVTTAQALGIFLGAAIILTLIFSLTILPSMLSSLSNFEDQIPTYWDRLQGVIRDNLLALEGRFAFAKNANLADSLQEQLNLFLAGAGKEYVGDVALFLLHWLPSLLLVPFLTFFFLRDGTAFHRLVLRAVPNAFFEKTLLLFDRMDQQMRAYFRGMFGLTMLDTVSLGLGLWFLGRGAGIFGFWDAMALGLICAVFAWVPYIGSGLGGLLAVATVAVKAPQSSGLMLAVVVLFLGVRLLDEFLYTPITVGRALRMHPLITVMMIFSGGMLGGVYGLLLAMPLLGIFTVLGQMFAEVWFDPRLRARYHARGMLEKKLASKDLGI